MRNYFFLGLCPSSEEISPTDPFSLELDEFSGLNDSVDIFLVSESCGLKMAVIVDILCDKF